MPETVYLTAILERSDFADKIVSDVLVSIMESKNVHVDNTDENIEYHIVMTADLNTNDIADVVTPVETTVVSKNDKVYVDPSIVSNQNDVDYVHNVVDQENVDKITENVDIEKNVPSLPLLLWVLLLVCLLLLMSMLMYVTQMVKVLE